MKNVALKKLTKSAILLAMMCVIGMFSVSFGDHVKVSLQLLILFVIFGVSDGLLEKILIPLSYLLLGLFLPIYAGFNAGVSPTFGFVISFVVIAIPFHFLMKLPLKMEYRFPIACLVSLLISYLIGTLFLKFYLNFDFLKALSIGVLPYIAIDIIKIIIATIIIKSLPERIFY